MPRRRPMTANSVGARAHLAARQPIQKNPVAAQIDR
jgi:hypothetical protein